MEAATKNYTRFVTDARQWAINEVKRILLETCMAVGFRSQRNATFKLNDIVSFVKQNTTYKTFALLFFVMHGSFDLLPDWVLRLEQRMMNELNWEYTDGFQSSGKKHGWVARIISDTKSSKLSDMNRALRTNVGYRITITGVTEKNFRRRTNTFNMKNMVVKVKEVSVDGFEEKAPQDLKRFVDKNGDLCLSRTEGTLLPVGIENTFLSTINGCSSLVQISQRKDPPIDGTKVAKAPAPNNDKQENIVQINAKSSIDKQEIIASTQREALNKMQKFHEQATQQMTELKQQNVNMVKVAVSLTIFMSYKNK